MKTAQGQLPRPHSHPSPAPFRMHGLGQAADCARDVSMSGGLQRGGVILTMTWQRTESVTAAENRLNERSNGRRV